LENEVTSDTSGAQEGIRFTQRGFTLVEVVVAAALLLMTFGALILSFTRMSRMSQAAQYTFDAMHTARSEIETMQTLPYASIVSFTNIPLTNNIMLSGVGGRKHCSVTPQTNQYKAVNLIITWKNPVSSTTSSVSLATIICNTNTVP
jgi:prepilin-type N-terminal cleavage/methylation domain-containing protein